MPLAIYPIRVGTNANTALALVLARRYGPAAGDRQSPRRSRLAPGAGMVWTPRAKRGSRAAPTSCRLL
ncbi:hypothetical protein ACNJYD_09520 [Bradyrhizobium sp. DASA03005]|uniref:hypothetical protein n=1 Tax=Bradyrhizobium sp. SPXBL-02 TaxID=3395912 RepID=UPI003F6F15B6